MKLRLIKAEHSCCFRSRVEQEIKPGIWEVVAEFLSEKLALQYINLIADANYAEHQQQQ